MIVRFESFGKRQGLDGAEVEAEFFLLPRHRMPATDYRADRARAFEAWHDVCGIRPAA